MKKLLFILPLVLCFITSCQDKVAQVELEEFRNSKKVCDQNKKIVSELFQAIDDNDFEKIDGLLADNFSLSSPGFEQPWNKENLFTGIKTFYDSFPDWIHNIENIIAEEDIVMVKIMMNGTHKTEYQGIAATHKQKTMAAASQIILVNGKVKEWWAIEDHHGFYKQLGMELKMKEENK